MPAIETLERPAAVLRGRRLEYFTVVWNTFEGLVAVVAGIVAGSISLVGFGIDSFIEVTSGSVLLWRMSVDSDVHRRPRNEKLALRIVGVCFLVLAAYIVYDSISDLWSKRAPEHSIAGIILACTSLVVMPILSRAKRKVGRALGRAARLGFTITYETAGTAKIRGSRTRHHMFWVGLWLEKINESCSSPHFHFLESRSRQATPPPNALVSHDALRRRSSRGPREVA
jgi:cation efflux family protein